MGNHYSFESLNPEKYEEVRLLSMSQWEQCSVFATERFPFETKPSRIKDDVLWEEFGHGITELLPLIDCHKGLILMLLPIMMSTAWFLSGDLKAEAGEHWTIYVIGGAIAIFIFFIACLSVIQHRNGLVDRRIGRLCGIYTRRFQEYGLAPEYRTKWTGMCKPGGVRARRMIVFIPTGNVTA